ncbi:hypothetical protein PG993_010476 [Apiospora rasikravindrae]|uniref:Uncharacterized protein n=1 Tax=Apiospora rasikravindrae TaxID=990691 RepID=A0ABR1SNP3_9PEZI
MWERYCDILLSKIAVEIERVEALNPQIQKLRKRISSHIAAPVSEDCSLIGLFTDTLYWAIIKEDYQRAEEDRQRQQRDRQHYQQSLNVFAHEPELIAAQLRRLEKQVRAMRAVPGGTEDAFRQRENEWLWLVRHVDGIRWHLEKAFEYANEIRASSDKRERESLASELEWLIENHAGMIYRHIIQMDPSKKEKQQLDASKEEN